ncbi:MAG: PKD domain-containing protein, partial [Bacteroidota bacterium]
MAECEGFTPNDFVACDNVGGCNCDFELDPVCVLDSINGAILPFPNACFAECEGYTADDFVDCGFGGPSDCHAYFNYEQDPNDPNTVSFTDLSTGATAWFWDFGDGNTSEEQNPVHTYAESGWYEVVLIISGEDCTATTIQSILVGVPVDCNCDFELYPVCVVDSISGTILPFLNPCLAECAGYTEEDFVDCEPLVNPCPTSFFYTQDDPTSNTVNFIDNSTADNIVSWFWDFGDGNTSEEQNPVHTYADGGIYDVTLRIVTADDCMGTYTEHLCIGDGVVPFPFPECQAFFYFDQHDDELLTFHFSDFSFGAASTWFWDFGDGNTSEEQNPTHSYAEGGVYEVTLTITTADGCENAFRLLLFADDNAWYNGACNALFMPLIISDTEVVFINTSAPDAIEFEWDLGDGTTSTEPFPQHTYAEPGSYEVTLTITTVDGCTNSFTMTVDLSESLFFGTANSIDLTTSTTDLSTIQALRAYPNPVVDQLNIDLNLEEGSQYEVELINAAGQVLRSQQYQLARGEQTLNLDVRTLPAGLYFARLRNAQQSKTIKFV